MNTLRFLSSILATYSLPLINKGLELTLRSLASKFRVFHLIVKPGCKMMVEIVSVTNSASSAWGWMHVQATFSRIYRMVMEPIRPLPRSQNDLVWWEQPTWGPWRLWDTSGFVSWKQPALWPPSMSRPARFCFNWRSFAHWLPMEGKWANYLKWQITPGHCSGVGHAQKWAFRCCSHSVLGSL